jgi:hypothetical protein
MRKQKLKLLDHNGKKTILPACPSSYTDLLTVVSRYTSQNPDSFSLVITDSEGDECEILDEATYKGSLSEFSFTVSISLVPHTFQRPLPETKSRPSLKYFKKRTRFCFIYYLDTKETTMTRLDVGISLKEYAAWVDLPDGSVFYCGGGYPVSSNEAFLISPVSGKYKRLPSMLYSRHSHGIIYFQGHVFVFGGLENQINSASIITKCEKFNLELGIWQEIEEIQTPRADVSASVFHDKILVFGKGSRCVSDYFYCEQFLDLGEDCGGCSIVYEKIFYVFQGSCIKVWDLEKMSFCERVLMSKTKSWWSHSPPIWFEGCIYFVWWEEPGWICCFNTLTKSFTKLILTLEKYQG